MLGRYFVYADRGSAVTLFRDMLSHSDAKDILSHSDAKDMLHHSDTFSGHAKSQ